MKLTYAQLDQTPVGPMSLVAGDKGLQRVAFTTLKNLKQILSLSDGTPSLEGFQTLGVLLVEINAYLCGLQRAFSVAIDWEIMDGFQKQVLTLTAEIPYGQVLSYGAVAKKLGKPSAARAVGSALRRNPMPIVIPCHRVIGADHVLHGYIGGVDVKAHLLSLEGHLITDNHRVK